MGSGAENLANQKLTNSLSSGETRRHEAQPKHDGTRTKQHAETLAGTTWDGLCGIPSSAPDFARETRDRASSRQANTERPIREVCLAVAAQPRRRTLDGPLIGTSTRMQHRCFVYILRSRTMPSRHYTGLTGDIRARVAAHNAGECSQTSKFRPWKVVVSMEFPTQEQASKFEKYLKSGSGRAFTKRHFS